MHPFQLSSIDHVAIRVADIKASVEWYESVLGLKKVAPKEWQPYPIFMMQAKFGVALFPARIRDPQLDTHSKNVKIDHFAFNVTKEAFQKAQVHFQKIGIPFEFQDHHYFHSIYLNDPDGHTVELTTLVKGENIFD
ncbi:VOC family protein [Fulvivirga lutea]|uniref:VOC family protein n=1 Tax=Fulvivirga lutea TaxID=2810512 RepID=A0A974WF42_9BACT|nr:VOC family protein [Fulvivirga lutea]QSE95917.1 VOC family protein [Fulvivirga lutea]